LKPLVCNRCKTPGRPRGNSRRCPACGKGTLEEITNENNKPISLETVFKTKAQDAKVTVTEKTL